MTRELGTGAAAGVAVGSTLAGAVAPLALSVDVSDVRSGEGFPLVAPGSVDFDGVVFGESFALGDSVFLPDDCCVTGSREGGGASRLSGIDGGTGADEATDAAGAAGLGRIVLESSVPEAEDRSGEFVAWMGRPDESLIVKSRGTSGGARRASLARPCRLAATTTSVIVATSPAAASA